MAISPSLVCTNHVSTSRSYRRCCGCQTLGLKSHRFSVVVQTSSTSAKPMNRRHIRISPRSSSVNRSVQSSPHSSAISSASGSSSESSGAECTTLQASSDRIRMPVVALRRSPRIIASTSRALCSNSPFSCSSRAVRTLPTVQLGWISSVQLSNVVKSDLAARNKTGSGWATAASVMGKTAKNQRVAGKSIRRRQTTIVAGRRWARRPRPRRCAPQRLPRIRARVRTLRKQNPRERTPCPSCRCP